MGPDDFAEKKQVNHTPTIALAVAAILLLIVGALSYRDFVRTRFEKEFAEKEEQMMQRIGYFDDTRQGRPEDGPRSNQQPGSAAPGGYSGQANGRAYEQNDPRTQDPALAQSAADMQVESALPRPNDPEVDRIQDSLNQAREQSRRTGQRYGEITGDVDSRARESAESRASESSEAITSELPDFLREAAENPPGGNAEVEEQLARLREQVRRAPSLAQVTSYDKEWGVVTFNAGSKQLVKKDQRFAVRRGTDILGWVKVDQVEDNESVAVLVTKNRDSETALKPDVGDDLIDFELF